MPLYVFEVGGTAYFKMGFTAVCPWMRVSCGLWSNVHPTACCDKLGWDNLELVALFEGTMADEKALQEAIPPERGEFWPSSRYEELLKAMSDKLVEKVLPPRPSTPPRLGRGEERLSCCLGGRDFKCGVCAKVFARHHLLVQHRASHSMTADRVTCRRCGLVGLKRNIFCKRHRETAACKAKE
jgi:hypothetical protein